MEEKNILLEEVKNYLDITWEDSAGDRKLAGILERGKSYLNRIAGAELNYEREEQPKELLFDYARYARAGALDDFGKNYHAELLAMQITEEVKAYAESEGTDV